jgi:hypothetical protein
MDDQNKQLIHEAIEASQHGNEMLEEGVLIGWIVVAEWLNYDGTRSLLRMSGTPGGTQPPEWQARGYLHEALFGTWNGEGA